MHLTHVKTVTKIIFILYIKTSWQSSGSSYRLVPLIILKIHPAGAVTGVMPGIHE